MDNLNVVFIVDKRYNNKKIGITSRDLEKTELKYYNEVYNALTSISNHVYVYHSPKQFIKNIAKHENDIVLSIWSGTKSKSRKSLIPAICESYNIKYVGASSFVQSLSQNKMLSKEYCKKFNIKSSNYIYITNENYYNVKDVKLPAIIKPADEGGSIGISQKNLVCSYDSAKKMINKLLKHYSALVMEEYIEGYEVSVIICGTNKRIDIFEAIGTECNKERYFKNFIWGFENKKAGQGSKSKYYATNLLKEEEIKNLEKLFFSLGKVDYMRIDGRINENGFHLIELSPDAHLGKEAGVDVAFEINGFNYKAMFEKLINLPLEED